MKCGSVLMALFIATQALAGTSGNAGEYKMVKLENSAEEQVLRLEEEFVSAWNRGDADRVAGFFAEDGVRVGAYGDIARGRRELRAAYDKLLNGSMKGAHVVWDPSARAISDDLVLAEGQLSIVPPNGIPAIRGYALDIWKRTDDKWEMIEAHPKFYPPKPGH